MNEIQIIIDPIGHNRLGGWARHASKPHVHVTLNLSIDESFIGLVTASNFRPDLVAARIGTGHYGWSLEIPQRFMDGRIHRVHAKDLASGKEVISELKFPKPQVLFAIDHVTGRGVQGWVADPSTSEPLVVFLESQGEDIARSIANDFREDLLKYGIGSGKHAFRLTVPLEVTLRGLDNVRFGYYDSFEQKIYLDALDLPRGLIYGAMIACHVPQGDASKYYRAELQARHLWQSGCEVVLESHERAASVDFSTKDFVIFQRSPVDEDVKKSISVARKAGMTVFYETDDLNMFMELRHEFGSVKSGIVDMNAADLISWVQRRFTAANFADTIIVPNLYMKRWLHSHGYDSIVSEFFMEDRNILSRRKSKIGNSWRMLYMSGSRTHDDDFRQMELDLRYFLENNQDATLTILGDVQIDRFRSWPRTAIIEKQKYQDMLHIIDEHDIILAPFAKSVFNFAKSPTKFMEAASRGVPVIVSALPNYISHIRKAGVGYFVPWRKDWYDVLVTAKKNRIDDHRHGPDLCAYVKKNMAISSRGTALFWKISDEYGRRVALPSRIRIDATLQQTELTAPARGLIEQGIPRLRARDHHVAGFLLGPHRCTIYGTVGPGRAGSSPRLREFAMKIVVAGNCQIDGIARCLRVLAPQTTVESLPYSAMLRDDFDLGALLSGPDIIIAGDGGTLDMIRKGPIGNARIFGFPSIFFTGYHPDSIYPDHIAGTPSLLSPTGTNHSAIALAGWRAGLTVAETAGLFNARTFAHLGYFDHWNHSRQRLLDQSAALGLNLEERFAAWGMSPPFMLTPNHPKLIVLAEVARQIAHSAGLKTTNAKPEQFLAEEMLKLVVWPVYPEIAESLGFDGNYIFKLQDNGNMDKNPSDFLLDLEDYLTRSFKMYDEADTQRFAFHRLDDPRYNEVIQGTSKTRTVKATSASPYSALPDSNFWRRSVSKRDWHDIDPIIHNFEPRISHKTAIVTAGSCFAQHIAARLHAAGYNYYVAENAPDGTTAEEAKRKNYGIYSARYGNIYSTRQLLQLIKMSVGEFAPSDKFWRRSDGRYIDPYRPNILDEGFSSPEELLFDRREHLAAVRRMLANSEIFIFTLGLTEIWTSVDDGAVYPLPPGSVGASVAPGSYQFVNLTMDEVRSELLAIIDMLQNINPQIRIILTVSPVPLIATYEGTHVVCATTYSKSILRVAADEASRLRPDVNYFPSYEIITSNFSKGLCFEDDFRTVSPDGVDRVMKLFFEHYTTSVARQDFLDHEHIQGRKIICDEENLEPAISEKPRN